MSSAHHFIIGGQRSGKSRHAERLAVAWQKAQPGRRVTVVATAVAADEEMAARVLKHRQDRPEAFETHEEGVHLGGAVRALSAPDRLVLIDCLTLWWSQVMFSAHAPQKDALHDDLLAALAEASGPVILISNEIGQGVIPLGAEVRAFVDELGRLHQQVVQRCGVITWMVAGQAFTKIVEPWT